MKYLLFLLFPLTLNAQLNWIIQDKTFSQDDTVRVKFTVEHFDSIVAYQYAVHFDTSHLMFVGIDFPSNNPLGLSSDDFGLYELDKGLIRHLWSNPWGTTLVNGTHIFTYLFKAKSSGILSNDLTLVTCCLNPPLNPMAFKFIIDYVPLNIIYDNANQLVSIEELSLNKIKVYPNPVIDYLNIIDKDSKEQNVVVYNSQGQVTYTQKGTNLKISKSNFTKGINLVKVNNQLFKVIKE